VGVGEHQAEGHRAGEVLQPHHAREAELRQGDHYEVVVAEDALERQQADARQPEVERGAVLRSEQEDHGAVDRQQQQRDDQQQAADPVEGGPVRHGLGGAQERRHQQAVVAVEPSRDVDAQIHVRALGLEHDLVRAHEVARLGGARARRPPLRADLAVHGHLASGILARHEEGVAARLQAADLHVVRGGALLRQRGCGGMAAFPGRGCGEREGGAGLGSAAPDDPPLALEFDGRAELPIAGVVDRASAHAGRVVIDQIDEEGRAQGAEEPQNKDREG
jgi:hypothetical protein